MSLLTALRSARGSLDKKPFALQLVRSISSSNGALRPRRGFLFMPGSSEKMIRKGAAQLDADCVVMDCEDGVALSSKADARSNIIKLLDELSFGRSEAAVRINSPDTGDLAEDDLRAMLTAPTLPHCLVVPKVDSADQVSWLMDRADALLKSSPSPSPPPPLPLVMMAESAIGLLNLRSSIEQALAPRGDGRAAPLKLEGIVLGGDDYAASIGAVRQPKEGSPELLTARQTVVMNARAYGLQAIDIVSIDLSGSHNLMAEALSGARMGFTGKQIIHPKQIEPVQTAFTPSPESIAAAQELVDAFEEHAAKGLGAFTFKGQMIDNPTVLQARNLLAQVV